VFNNFRNLTSLYRSLGARWLLFRVSYSLRMQTGFIRKQVPAYQLQDRPLGTWLKEEIPSQVEAYARWRRGHSHKFFFNTPHAEQSDSGDEARIPGDVPWNPQPAVDEAERLLNGEPGYHNRQTGFPPDWHRDPITELN
jgi:hypothetical protein